jgi:hypothetical protein
MRVRGRDKMKKGEVIKRLGILSDMSNEEIAINADWVRELARDSYALFKNKDFGKKG